MPISGAAEYLGVSKEYVRRLLRNGQIKGTRFSGIWVVNKQSLEAYKRKKNV